MLALDVNILVSAFHAEATDSEAMRSWLTAAVADHERLGVSDSVLIGVARILTNRRIFRRPATGDQAWSAIGRLVRSPGVARLAPGPGHLGLVEQLCRDAGATGNLVSDAQHAAVAIEHGATFVTKDRDFARFPGLRWRHPFDPAPA